MRFLILLLIVGANLLLTLFSYVNRLYAEKGRFLIRGSKDNVDFFEREIEPKLNISLERAELTFPLLIQVDVVLLSLLVAAWHWGRSPGWDTIGEAAVFLIVDVMVFAQVIPPVLLTRTVGRWLLRSVGLLRVSVLLVAPLVAISQFLHYLASLGSEEAQTREPSPSENIEALMLAGEEEGLLEREDRRLIQSVVEFGDKTAREVMTPRPEIFAISADTTLLQLKQTLTTRRFSRIPVYEGDLDHVVGFLRATDLLQFNEGDLPHQTVRLLVRPLTFVPETKPIAQLLRELRQKAPIAMVVDEYGSVAGLVTIEDMVEEIVGEIRDEHEVLDVISQGEGTFRVPGSMDVDRLQELFGMRTQDNAGATTVSGLMTSFLGRVPGAGETLEKDGLLFRVLESNGRRVLRVLISRSAGKPPGALDSPTETPSWKGRTRAV